MPVRSRPITPSLGPSQATASWSSSGVILAVENFTAFDEV